VVTNAKANAKGWPWTENKDNRTFTVKEGAMFVNAATDESLSFGPHRVHIAGTGVNGEGAIVNLSSKQITFCMFRLDGDAKIVSRHNNGYFCLGPYSDTHGHSMLNGHTLTVDTANTLTMFRNGLHGEDGGLIRVTGGNLTFGAEAGKDFPFLCVEPMAGAFAMANSGMISVMRDVPNIQVPLTIESGADVMFRHLHDHRGTDCAYNANSNAWAGPVTIEEGATLRMRTNCGDDGKYFRITGNITGAGTLVVPSKEQYNPISGDIYIESPTNSFTGTILIGTNVNSGSVYLSYSNSVPDYSKCELVYGYVTARLTPGDHAWTPASLVAFVNGINRSGDTHVAMDARPMPDGKASFAISEFTPYQNKDIYEFGADGGTVEISGVADKPVSLFAVDGTLRFTGEAVLTNTVASSVGVRRFGEILFDGAKVTTGIDGAYLGVFRNCMENAWPLDTTPVGRIRVKDSEFLTDYGCVLDGNTLTAVVDGKLTTNLLYGAVKVGWKGRGVFEVEGDSVVSNKFLIGCTLNTTYPNPNSPHQCQYGYGAFYQRGGDVTFLGNKWWASTSYAFGLGVGPKSFGYLEASGGKTVIAGQMSCGAYGTGMIYVDGGDVTATNHPAEPATKLPVLYLGALNYSRCAMYVKNGGRFRTRGETRVVINAASGMNGIFTASGEGSFMGFGTLVNGSKNVPLGNGVIYNAIDGGTVEGRYFYAANVTPETNFVNVCMNGGTFRAFAYNYNLFGHATTDDGEGPPTVVRIYGKGGAVDTAGFQNVNITAPVKAAHGGGVSSVPWTPRTGCQYPPIVRIVGDGYGASAMAEFDSVSGTVTGVTVTSPGCGYTWAKALFNFGYEGTASTLPVLTNECVIAENDGTGSFTKKGEGTLSLKAVCSWGGDTVLAGGTLKSCVDGAIPAGGTFVLAGGTLDMNGTTLSDGSAMPKKWAVDVRTALEDGTVTYNGDLLFPEGSTLELRGGEDLADSDPTTTILAVTGSVIGAPALPELGNPRWKAWWSGNSIKVKKFYGTTVVFR
jgi:autotransporter-associated beta strand protein